MTPALFYSTTVQIDKINIIIIIIITTKLLAGVYRGALEIRITITLGNGGSMHKRHEITTSLQNVDLIQLSKVQTQQESPSNEVV